MYFFQFDLTNIQCAIVLTVALNKAVMGDIFTAACHW